MYGRRACFAVVVDRSKSNVVAAWNGKDRCGTCLHSKHYSPHQQSLLATTMRSSLNKLPEILHAVSEKPSCRTRGLCVLLLILTKHFCHRLELGSAEAAVFIINIAFVLPRSPSSKGDVNGIKLS